VFLCFHSPGLRRRIHALWQIKRNNVGIFSPRNVTILEKIEACMLAALTIIMKPKPLMQPQSSHTLAFQQKGAFTDGPIYDDIPKDKK